MSDLGAIFHVKKESVQYDAHAYTTLDECPEPNLKVMYKGQQGYVKLDAKGEGDIPCYVKTKAGNTYQVKKEAVPTGSVSMTRRGNGREKISLTIPAQIHVLQLKISHSDATAAQSVAYIGVTPNKTYSIYLQIALLQAVVVGHWVSEGSAKIWWRTATKPPIMAIISWSSEINKQTPTVEDYN